jgi:hypothetical protein
MYNYGKVWIDPPEGWRFGFPKIWNSQKDPDLRIFLLDSGYPANQVAFALNYIRMWNVEENESNE